MAHQYRPANALHLQISPHLHLSSVQLASLIHIVAALMAALIALALLRPLPAAASIQPSLFDYPASARDQAFPQTADLALALAPEPLWLAIDDDRSGVTVELPWKWHETAQSPRHEQEVLQSPGWTFSRLYDCTKPACGTTIRAIISGGLLPAGLNISNVDDLHRKMPLPRPSTTIAPGSQLNCRGSGMKRRSHHAMNRKCYNRRAGHFRACTTAQNRLVVPLFAPSFQAVFCPPDSTSPMLMICIGKCHEEKSQGLRL